MKTRPTAFLLCCIFSICAFAKQEKTDWTLAQAYSIVHGLPSNRIYSVAEDKQGFLWIATDNGVSRFDGKHFRNYTQLQGLPDNEAIQVAVDHGGTVWVNTYPLGLVYFDALNDRFVTLPSLDSILSADRVSNMRLLKCPKEGVIYFGNSIKWQQVFYEFKNQRLVNRIPFQSKDRSILLSYYVKERPAFRPNNTKLFDIFYKRKLVDSIFVNPKLVQKVSGSAMLYDTAISYFLYKDVLFSIQPKGRDSSHVLITSTKIDSSINHVGIISGNRLLFTSRTSLFIYDKLSLQLLETFPFQNILNYAWIDQHENLWVCTDGDGLLLLKHRTHRGLKDVAPNCRNVCALQLDAKKQLVYGLVSGEVFSFSDKGYSKKISAERNDAYVRKILNTKNETFCITDRGLWIDWKKINVFRPSEIAFKDALVLGDSLLFLCGLGKQPLLTYNLKTNQVQCCPVKNLPRIDHLLEVDHQTLYFSRNEELYRYSISNQNYRRIALTIPSKVRILTMYRDHQQRVWLGLSNQTVLVLQEEKIIATFDQHQHLTEEVTAILQLDRHRFVFGTRNGMFLFQEDTTQSKLAGSFIKYTMDDGLLSNQINTFLLSNDSLYIGTTDGISILSSALTREVPKLHTHLVSCEINGIAYPIQNSYQLSPGKKQIQLSFMSPSLTGGLNYVEYSIDEGLHWQRVHDHTINLLLDNGSNKVLVRSVNNDLKPGVPLEVLFAIQLPFYASVWFWVVLSVISTGLIFYAYNRRKIQKQKLHFEKMNLLTIQRQKITADLHDDIGSSLSSLQINSAVAQRLMEQNKPEAKDAILKVEMQSRALSEKVSDFIWSLKPMQEEFMTLGTRIRSFASEILGAKEIPYTIQIQEEVNRVIQDPTLRKNILLIVKEAINNIAKYSEATQVDIQLQIVQGILQLLVRDNGKGFQRELAKGNGLQNMEKRAKEIGATYKLQSVPGQGTEISLSLNLTTN